MPSNYPSVPATFPNQGIGAAALPASKPAEKPKRPPASPATGSKKLPVVKGQTPVKSPPTKKNKVDRVESYVDEVLSKSNSPMAPPTNVSEDLLDREDPTPIALESTFAGAAGEQPCESAVGGDETGMDVDMGMDVPCQLFIEIFYLYIYI